MEATKPKKPRTMSVGGLTWKRTTDHFGPCWQAEDGPYRVTIDTSKIKPTAMVYRLDPKYKAFRASGERLDQECLLNDVWPTGRTLQEVMEDAAKKIHLHQDEHGSKFLGATTVVGRELKAGMHFHHKGVFRPIKKIETREGVGGRVSELLVLCSDLTRGARVHRIGENSVCTVWIPFEL